MGTIYGSILSFTTGSVAVDASVMTLPATDITEHAAVLHGVVLADAGHWGFTRFQWGLTPEYGRDTPWVGGFVSGDVFEYSLSGLTEGMGYHFRAQFKHSPFANGADAVFHTLVPLGPLVLITDEQVHLLEESI